MMMITMKKMMMMLKMMMIKMMMMVMIMIREGIYPRIPTSGELELYFDTQEEQGGIFFRKCREKSAF